MRCACCYVGHQDSEGPLDASRITLIHKSHIRYLELQAIYKIKHCTKRDKTRVPLKSNMKWEFGEDAVLKLSGIATLGYGVHALSSPNQFQVSHV